VLGHGSSPGLNKAQPPYTILIDQPAPEPKAKGKIQMGFHRALVSAILICLRSIVSQRLKHWNARVKPKTETTRKPNG